MTSQTSWEDDNRRLQIALRALVEENGGLYCDYCAGEGFPLDPDGHIAPHPMHPTPDCPFAAAEALLEELDS